MQPMSSQQFHPHIPAVLFLPTDCTHCSRRYVFHGNKAGSVHKGLGLFAWTCDAVFIDVTIGVFSWGAACLLPLSSSLLWKGTGKGRGRLDLAVKRDEESSTDTQAKQLPKCIHEPISHTELQVIRHIRGLTGRIQVCLRLNQPHISPTTLTTSTSSGQL